MAIGGIGDGGLGVGSLYPPLINSDGIGGPDSRMEIGIEAVGNVVGHKLAGIAEAGGQCVRVKIDERAKVVIEVNAVVQSLAGLDTRWMPWLEGLSDEAANKPVADRLGQEVVAFARGKRGEGPMREGSD